MNNASAVILRNESDLRFPALMMGLEDEALLPALKDQVDVLCTHSGLAASLETRAGRVWFGYETLAQEGPRYGTVVIFMPKAQRELELRVALARTLVASDGELWLVGAKREGINGGARRFKEQLDGAWKRDNARHCQLWSSRAEAQPPAFDMEYWYCLRPVESHGERIQVADFPGVFSEGRLDDGTDLLLGTFSDKPRGPVLDFACGAGVVGVWLLSRWPDLTLTLLDVQAQAVACAKRTLAANQAQAEVLASDGLGGVHSQFGTIVTNPPFHEGIRTDTTATERFIHDCAQHLVRGGSLRLVANRFLPYPDLIQKTLGPVTTLAENSRFCVYEAHKR
ncbi:class I SAM-dependent methyltransferase [Marinobacteraceae bacterium S3BR75-40.1]